MTGNEEPISERGRGGFGGRARGHGGAGNAVMGIGKQTEPDGIFISGQAHVKLMYTMYQMHTRTPA